MGARATIGRLLTLSAMLLCLSGAAARPAHATTPPVRKVAYVYINDRDISDSGDDALPVSRHGHRWLLDAD